MCELEKLPESEAAYAPLNRDDRPQSSLIHAVCYTLQPALLHFLSPLPLSSSRFYTFASQWWTTPAASSRRGSSTRSHPQLRQQQQQEPEEEHAAQEGGEGGEGAPGPPGKQPEEWHRMSDVHVRAPRSTANAILTNTSRSASPMSVNRPFSKP